MAKTREDLEASRKQREALKAKWGGEIPSSVWQPDYSIDCNIATFGGSQYDVAMKKHAKRVADKETGKHGLVENPFDLQSKNDFSSSGRTVRGKTGGLSVFPYDLVRRVVLFYTDEGDTVLDPCAGHNSRMQAVWLLKRSYIGYDVCHRFMEFNRQVVKKLSGESGGIQPLYKPKGTITLHEQSSEDMVEGDSTVDLVFTSPPYWDLEYYDDHPDQLGRRHSYKEFLEGLGRIASESYRVLRAGKFCVFNINDFRKDGKYFIYHADIVPYFERQGFTLWDVIIVKWHSSFGKIFATQIEDRKRMPKEHEYLMVFKKPEEGKP